MKRILFLLLFVFCVSYANAQQTFKFGNVTMKDTASGSLNLKSGGLYTGFMYTNGNITLNGDSGVDFILTSTSSNGLMMYMNGIIADYSTSSINLFVPVYLPQYSNSEISELIVGSGAMIINSDTQEVWVYLDNQWQILDTK